MGHYLVNAVFNGLRGKYPKLNEDEKTKTKFSINSLTMLAVVANGQPNPIFDPNGITFCYLDEVSMCDLVHLKRSCMYETRKFLNDLGLLNFHEYLEHQNIHNPMAYGTPFEYTNVYQVNVPAIRALHPTISDDVWGKKFLHISKEDYGKMNAAQLKMLGIGSMLGCGSAVHNTDGDVRNTDEAVRITDEVVRITDTNKKRQNKKQNNNTTAVAVEPFGGRESDEFQSLIKRMATDFGVNEKAIGQKAIWDNVKNRDPQAVDEAIDEFAEKVRIGGLNKCKQPGKIIGLFVESELKPIPELPPEKLKEAVENYTIRPTPAQKKQNELAELRTAAWKEVITVLHLEGLQDVACNALRERLDSLLAKQNDSRMQAGILQMLKENVQYDIGKLGGDIMTAKPKPEDRVKFLEDKLDGICRQIGG